MKCLKRKWHNWPIERLIWALKRRKKRKNFLYRLVTTSGLKGKSRAHFAEIWCWFIPTPINKDTSRSFKQIWLILQYLTTLVMYFVKLESVTRYHIILCLIHHFVLRSTFFFYVEFWTQVLLSVGKRLLHKHFYCCVTKIKSGVPRLPVTKQTNNRVSCTTQCCCVESLNQLWPRDVQKWSR